MVCPILEYGSSVWDPHTDKLQDELEKVHNRAARLVTRNYVDETGSMTGILGQLKWESLKERIKDSYCYVKDVYKYSIFPKTIRDWNDLSESLISSSELSDDSVSKFTSLVRARD